MLPSKKPQNQTSLFFSFDSTLNQKHPLFVLANRIDWTVFENAFSPLYCLDNGRPAKPIRLMVGLLMLKHIRNISDESVVEQWSENNYYQPEFDYYLQFRTLGNYKKYVSTKNYEVIAGILRKKIAVSQCKLSALFHKTQYSSLVLLDLAR